MERNQPDGRAWDSFYARNMHLPSPKLTAVFLSGLPQAARVLDFGAGTGAWSAAFLRDRPDIAIDVLDKNIDKAAALPQNFSGQKLALSFEDYRAPQTPYDAIWARSVLFFLEQPAIKQCVHELSKSLTPEGTLAFTMVDDCPAAAVSKFHGMSEASIREMLDKEGLELVSITRSEPPYGSKRIPIPTFELFARKR